MTCISWVNRNLAGRVRSGQEMLKISRLRSGRVRSSSNLTVRVVSGQEFFTFHWSRPFGLGYFHISRVGLGRVRRFPNPPGSGLARSRHAKMFAGQVGSADPTRLGLAREVWPVPRASFLYSSCVLNKYTVVPRGSSKSELQQFLLCLSSLVLFVVCHICFATCQTEALFHISPDAVGRGFYLSYLRFFLSTC